MTLGWLAAGYQITQLSLVLGMKLPASPFILYVHKQTCVPKTSGQYTRGLLEVAGPCLPRIILGILTLHR